MGHRKVNGLLKNEFILLLVLGRSNAPQILKALTFEEEKFHHW